MDVREKIVELLQDENNPVWNWFPNNMAMTQLADYLIANGVTVQEWISVKERLPERDGPVLTSYGFSEGGEISNMRFFSVMGYYAVDPKPHFQYEGYHGLTVTHWMPLPKLPKGE